MTFRPIIVVACLAFAAPLAASAAAPSHAAMEALSAWARPTVPGMKTGAAYLTLVNRTEVPDRLVSASTPWAERMDLHQSAMRGGIMSMRPVPDGVAIPPHGRVTLQPGGYHFMLSGLKRRLTVGARMPAELRFQHAGTLRVEFRVQAGPPNGEGGMGPMG